MKPGNALSRHPDESEINLTPMLDVVFIMLIFFIVTATFIRETGLPAKQPGDRVEERTEAEAILVRIDSNDDIWVDNRVVDRRAVRANIERLHAQSPEFPVVIYPGRASTADVLVAVMDAANAVNVAEVSITPDFLD